MGASFIGPGAGEIPETVELRKLKRVGEADPFKRGHDTAAVKVGIKTSGVSLTIDPEATRGDAALLLAKAMTRRASVAMTLARRQPAAFQDPRLAKELKGECYHLATSAAGWAQKADPGFWSWMWRGATIPRPSTPLSRSRG